MRFTKLKDCCTIIAGQSPESKYYNTDGDGLPFFQGKADFGELYPTVRVYCSQPTKIAEKDDILLSVRAPVGPTNLSPGRVCIGRGLTAIRPSKELNLKFLLFFFKYFEAQLQQQGTGTTFKAITQDVIKNLEVPIPPLTEQQRIVARTEELFSQLDSGVETLRKTKQQLAVYRQAVLKEAFEGNYPDKPLSEISKAISGYAFKSKRYSPDGKYTVVKIGNVKPFHFDFSRDLTRTDEADDAILNRCLLQYGDCLITLTGTRGKRDYGFIAMITDEENFLLNQRVAALRFDTRIANPRFYLNILMNSPAAWVVLSACTVLSLAFAIFTWRKDRQKKIVSTLKTRYRITEKGTSHIRKLQLLFDGKSIDSLKNAINDTSSFSNIPLIIVFAVGVVALIFAYVKMIREIYHLRLPTKLRKHIDIDTMEFYHA